MTKSTSDLDKYVDAKIDSGEFRSREEFFLEKTRIYRELEARHADLRSLIQQRIGEADRSPLETLDIDAIKAELAQGGRPRRSPGNDVDSCTPPKIKRPANEWSPAHRLTQCAGT